MVVGNVGCPCLSDSVFLVDYEVRSSAGGGGKVVGERKDFN